MKQKKKINKKVAICLGLILIVSSLSGCSLIDEILEDDETVVEENTIDEGSQQAGIEVESELNDEAETGESEDAEPNANESEATFNTYIWMGDSNLDFTAKTYQGDTFTLSEQAGKVVLLNFWATWCGPCVGEMPAIQWLYDEYDPADVTVMTVNVWDDSEAEVTNFLLDNEYTLPCIIDSDGQLGGQYGLYSIPATIIFNRDGTIAQSFLGALGAEEQYEEYKTVIEDALSR